jgi:hypothetical protein
MGKRNSPESAQRSKQVTDGLLQRLQRLQSWLAADRAALFWQKEWARMGSAGVETHLRPAPAQGLHGLIQPTTLRHSPPSPPRSLDLTKISHRPRPSTNSCPTLPCSSSLALSWPPSPSHQRHPRSLPAPDLPAAMDPVVRKSSRLAGSAPVRPGGALSILIRTFLQRRVQHLRIRSHSVSHFSSCSSCARGK